MAEQHKTSTFHSSNDSRRRIFDKLDRLGITSILHERTGVTAEYIDGELRLAGEDKALAHAEMYVCEALKIIQDSEERARKYILSHHHRYKQEDVLIQKKEKIEADLEEIGAILHTGETMRVPKGQKKQKPAVKNPTNALFRTFKNTALHSKTTVTKWRDLCAGLQADIKASNHISDEKKNLLFDCLSEKQAFAEKALQDNQEQRKQIENSFPEDQKKDILDQKRTYLREKRIDLDQGEDENLTWHLFKAIAKVTLTPGQFQEIDNKCHASFEKDPVPEEKLLEKPELEYVEGIAVGNGMQMFRVYYNRSEKRVFLDYTLRCVDFIPALHDFLTPEMTERINKPQKTGKQGASIFNEFQYAVRRTISNSRPYQTDVYSQGITLRHVLDEDYYIQETQVLPTAGQAITQVTYESFSTELGKDCQAMDVYTLDQFIRKNTNDEGIRSAQVNINGQTAFDILAAISARELQKAVFAENMPAIMCIAENNTRKKRDNKCFIPASMIENREDVTCKLPLPGRETLVSMVNGGLLLYKTGFNAEQMKAIAYLCYAFRRAEDLPREMRFQG